MILRVFRGRTRPGMGAAFERFLRERAVPQLCSRSGMMSVHVGRPTPVSPDEFLVMTVWRDMDALRAFAGERWDRTVMGRDESRLLAGASVHHYEALDSDVPLDLPEEAAEPWARALDVGSVRLDLIRQVARLDGHEVELPPREFAVLVELALHPDQPIPSDELARRAWPEGNGVTGDDVRRTVYRLRRLLGDHRRDRPLIRNRRGYGYLLSSGGR